MCNREIVSIALPRIFPTTGTATEITDLPAFFVKLSRLFVNPPSSEAIVINNVSAVEIPHIDPFFINLEIFSTFTSSEIFEIIPKAVDAKISGITKFDITLFINDTINNNIGSITPAELILPVAIINVVNNGINEFENAVAFCIVSLVLPTISAKFFIRISTTNMYSTKKAIFPVDSFPRFSEMDFKIAVITTTITIPAIDVIAFLKSCPNKLRQNFNILLLSNLPFNAFVKISEISKSSSSTYF